MAKRLIANKQKISEEWLEKENKENKNDESDDETSEDPIYKIKQQIISELLALS
jgi:hypothetical protein